MGTDEIIHKSIKQPEVSLEVTKTEGKYAKKEVVIKVSSPVEDINGVLDLLDRFSIMITDTISNTLERLGEGGNKNETD